jgi:GxxExxY protein
MTSFYHLESDKICYLAWAVWHKLGNGFSREIYADALEIEFTNAGVPFKRAVEVPIYYKDKLLPHTYTADFVVFDKIVLRVQAKHDITEANQREMLSMLQGCRLNLGIYINYSDKCPQFTRTILKSKFITSMSLRKNASPRLPSATGVFTLNEDSMNKQQLLTVTAQTGNELLHKEQAV